MTQSSTGHNRSSTAIHLHSLVRSFVETLASFLDMREETTEWIIPGSSDQTPSAQKVRVALSFLLRLYHLLHRLGLGHLSVFLHADHLFVLLSLFL
jgi:hypothetical protein